MYNKINDDLKLAMKNKDTFRLSVLRMLKSSLQLEGIAKNHELSDEEVSNILKKEVKKRKDSISEYEKYNRLEQVDNLKEEIKVLASYLPEEMTEEEITKVIDEIFAKVKPTSMKNMGQIMKELNISLAGKNADMSLASSIVKKKLSTM